MSETELRNQIAQIVADASEWDFDDSEYEGYGGDAARYWAADRILALLGPVAGATTKVPRDHPNLKEA